MYYVYFLELSNNNIYVGFSGDLKQRFKAHNDGKVPATAGFLPAKLKSYVAVETKENNGFRKVFQNWLRKSGSIKEVFIIFSHPTHAYLENRKITKITPKSPFSRSPSPIHANVGREGTHLSSIGEIGLIKINKIKKKRHFAYFL